MSKSYHVGGVLLLFVASAGLVRAEAPKEDRASHGYLGIMLTTPKDANQGILIREVTPDSPAAKAGLKAGDVVVKLNNNDVKDAEAFGRSVFEKKPGDKLSLTILRDGKQQTVDVALGERPRRPDVVKDHTAFLGVQIEELTADQRKQLNVENGAVVGEVMPNSAAAKAGLKRNDVITAVNDIAVKDPAALHDAIQKAGVGKEVALTVLRGKEKLTLKATLGEAPMRFRVEPNEEEAQPPNVESSQDHSDRRIRALERRMERLEKRLNELER